MSWAWVPANVSVEELASAPPLADLGDLDLSYNSIGVAGGWALVRSPYLRRRLELLWLENNFVGDEEDEDAVLESLAHWLGDGLRADSSPDEDDYEL